MLNIVLLEPEIPSNTGNVARTCAATNTRLHLIRPLGFEVSDKYLKRAGLDYWKDVDIAYYNNIGELFAAYPDGKFYFFTTKGKLIYSQAKFSDGDFLVFGKETRGLPEELLVDNYDRALRIPMYADNRSLNLANSVAIALYEALRQLDYPELNTEGELHRLATRVEGFVKKA